MNGSPAFPDNDQLISGRHIHVHQRQAMGFEHVTAMLLEHFDTPIYDGAVIILGDYIFHPIEHFRRLYPGARLIIYQLEQMVGSETWHPVQETIAHLAGADELWDYDPLNVTFLGWHGVAVDRVVPMLYTESLRRIPLQPEPAIDVLFVGYVNDRRHRILRRLEQQTYDRMRFMWLYGVKGTMLDRYLGDARIILNMHAFEPWHRQEQPRIFYPLINGRMVVSEPSQYNWFGDSIVEADEDDLAATLLSWLEDDRWRTFGLAASEQYRQRSAQWLANQERDAATAARVGLATSATTSVVAEKTPASEPAEWIRLIAALRVYRPDSRKVRLGGESDGGYVVPNRLLDRCTELISLGMRDDSRFEEDWFARTGKPVEMYDGQWPCGPICQRWPDAVGRAIRHHQTNAGAGAGMAPLSEIIRGRDDALLKLDVEGAEYALLAACDLGILNGLIVEAHDLDQRSARTALIHMLELLSENFVLVHLHGNDCSPPVALPNTLFETEMPFPSVLELVWVNRRILSKEPALDDEPYPVLGLDASNNRARWDLPLPWVNSQ